MIPKKNLGSTENGYWRRTHKSSEKTEPGTEAIFGRTGIETGIPEKLNKTILTQKIISEAPEREIGDTENGFNRTSCEE